MFWKLNIGKKCLWFLERKIFLNKIFIRINYIYSKFEYIKEFMFLKYMSNKIVYFGGGWLKEIYLIKD